MRLEDYSGMNIPDRLSPKARETFLTNLAYMHAAFGDNVEYERLFHQTLLCPETIEYLYTPPTPVSYKVGSRPILERAVEEATRGCTTECGKVIGLMSYIRDLKEKSGGRDYFYGGTEEELIKKGERYCERVARLMCALCEIAGLNARIIFHLTGGHLTNEVFADGKWRYVDPRFGLFYVDGEGQMLSVVELMRNPDVMLNQPEWVYEYGSKEYTHEFMMNENHNLYLRINEVQLYGEYSLSDSDKYHYEWMPSGIYNIPERSEVYKGYAKARLDYIDNPDVVSMI